MSATIVAPSASRVTVHPRVDRSPAVLADLYRRRAVRRAVLCVAFAHKASLDIQFEGDSRSDVYQANAYANAVEVEGIASMVLALFGITRSVETPDLSGIAQRGPRMAAREEWVVVCLERAQELLDEVDVDDACLRGAISSIEWAAGFCDCTLYGFRREPHLAILEDLLGTVR